MRMPWTTERWLRALEGAGLGFYLDRSIMRDPDCTGIDFQTEYKLTEDEIKSLEYAEGIVENGIFYVASARTEGEYYNAD